MGKIFNKKLLAIFAILLILVVLVIILIPSGSKEKAIMPPAPTSTPSPILDKNTIPISNPENRKPLTIISSTLPNRLLGLQEGFIIAFSQTPSTSEFLFEITPTSQISMTLKDKSVYIAPQPEWKPNTQYKIMIKSGTRDVYGNLLDKNFEISFKTVNARGM